MYLKHRKIIVTGGASGIGLATAKMAQDAGANVCVFDLGDADRTRVPGGIHFIGCDVADEPAIVAAVAEAAARMGGIDGVVNAAGIATRSSIRDLSAEALRRTIDVNLVGPFNVVRAVLSHMGPTGGSIVNVASGVALRPIANRSAYAASKGGLIAMSKAIAVDLAEDNIRVNVVCPGIIDTPMTSLAGGGAYSTPEQMRKIMERRLIRRPGTADEVAKAILFLISDCASYTTASVLSVDGGGTMT